MKLLWIILAIIGIIALVVGVIIGHYTHPQNVLISTVFSKAFQGSLDYAYGLSEGRFCNWDDLCYKNNESGYFDVYDINGEFVRHFGFAITSDQVDMSVLDFDWEWSFDDDEDKYVQTYEDSYRLWNITFDFDPVEKLKISHYIENSWQTTTNTKMWYVFTVYSGEVAVYDGEVYSLDEDYSYSGNLTDKVKKLTLPYATFDFTELDPSFEITNLYVGSGEPIGFPNARIIAIGMTKNDGVFPSGTSVMIDPSIKKTEDRTKVYDSETEEVNIRNVSLDTLADLRLTTPRINPVIRGNDRRVAEFSLDNYDHDYQQALSELEFYKGGQQIERDFVFKYEDVIDTEQRPDIERTCEYVQAGNGTWYDQCEDNIIGYKTVNITEWVEFNDLDELPNRMVKVGIFADVYPNERVEWIPTFFDVRIPEWAVWSEELNNDIEAYWTMNESAGTLQDLVGGRNGTVAGGMTQGAEGKIDNSIFTDAANEEVTTADLRVGGRSTNDGSWSISLWINTTSAGANKVAPYAHDDTGGKQTILWREGNNVRFYDVGVSTTDTEYSVGYSTTAGVWHHWVFVYNTSALVFYEDGSYKGSKGRANSFIWLDNFADIYTGNVDYSGHIDEVGVWNRTLSASEVTQLYNGGDGITYTAEVEEEPATVGQKLQIWRNASTGTNVSWVDNEGNWYIIGNVNVSGCIKYNCSGTCVTLGDCL